MNRPARIALVLFIVLVGGWVWWLSRPPPPPVFELVTERDDAGVEARPTTTVERLRASGSRGDGGVPRAIGGSAGHLASFTWGSGEGQLGKSEANESNPEAPMSLTVDALGNVWILDQVNNRLVKLGPDGTPQGNVPLPLQAAQDVAVTADGTALVMDRLVDKAIAVIGPDGKQKGELPLVGRGLEEGGASTGLFSDGNDVYVEREHGDSVLIGDSSGKASAERPEVPGRPAQDNKTYLTAGIVDGPSGLVMVTAIDKASRQHRFTRQLPMGQHVVGLNALDADQSGIIYLGVIVMLPSSTPEAAQFGVTLVCLDPVDGRPLAASQLPANSTPEETFREVYVLPQGGVVMLVRSELGAELVRYQCGQ